MARSEPDDRVIDWDAAWAEEDARAEILRPLRFTLYGREWELPFALPAAIPLRLAQWQVAGDDELTKTQLLQLAIDLFPQDYLEAWFAKGITADRLGQVIAWVIDRLMGDEAPTDAPEP